ncbi:helix-turn-helix transcriptional regulator [Bifidobacterium kimbladii]|uniref:helix-turn-helix transcriptional regulator n=1 Tax=Bifidobacterium TaxID=1678 RepID=UPI0028BE1954|nr:helix-turn-helix transcriptional regulator [Bifidobacterium sp. H1HS10N]MDT7513386.1 helix-turn-helix transcriptional regulator [Bifidobacterium sp. H1HS10N]
MSTRNPSGTGRRLASRRAAAGLTQRQLASRSGLSETVISDLETGRRDISHCRISTVLKITQELDCAIEDLL